MALFNFIMKDIKDIAPFGSQESGFSLYWFVLTDSYYWLNIGEHEILRYSDALINKYKDEFKLPYVDYYLSRLLEDFFEILPSISTPIIDDIFQNIEDYSAMDAFQKDLENWLEKWNEDDNDYDKIYEPAIKLLSDRSLDTGYLKGGPDIWFFRNNDKLFIRWDCDNRDEDGTRFWCAERGEYILNFSEFINEINDFYNIFWDKMNKQVDIACNNWPLSNVSIDLNGLVNEHRQRKENWDSLLIKLKNDTLREYTSWNTMQEAIRILKG